MAKVNKDYLETTKTEKEKNMIKGIKKIMKTEKFAIILLDFNIKGKVGSLMYTKKVSGNQIINGVITNVERMNKETTISYERGGIHG